MSAKEVHTPTQELQQSPENAIAMGNELCFLEPSAVGSFPDKLSSTEEKALVETWPGGGMLKAQN